MVSFKLQFQTVHFECECLTDVITFKLWKFAGQWHLTLGNQKLWLPERYGSYFFEDYIGSVAPPFCIHQSWIICNFLIGLTTTFSRHYQKKQVKFYLNTTEEHPRIMKKWDSLLSTVETGAHPNSMAMDTNSSQHFMAKWEREDCTTVAKPPLHEQVTRNSWFIQNWILFNTSLERSI